MLFDLGRCQSLIRVRLQDLVDQVDTLGGQSLRHLELATQDFLVELGCGFVFEGQVAGHHSKKDHATRPHVDSGAEVLQPVNHLGCCVAG